MAWAPSGKEAVHGDLVAHRCLARASSNTGHATPGTPPQTLPAPRLQPAFRALKPCAREPRDGENPRPTATVRAALPWGSAEHHCARPEAAHPRGTPQPPPAAPNSGVPATPSPPPHPQATPDSLPMRRKVPATQIPQTERGDRHKPTRNGLQGRRVLRDSGGPAGENTILLAKIQPLSVSTSGRGCRARQAGAGDTAGHVFPTTTL